MCLIIFSPNVRKAQIPMAVLERGFDRNDDGAGMAYLKDGKVVITKGFVLFHEFYDAYKAARKALKGPLLIHFRRLTKGSRSDANTQPLNITPDLVMVHNGTIDSLIDGEQDASDSVHLCRLIRRLDWPFPYSRAQIDLLTVICDSKSAFSPNRSKLVFLNAKGQFQIINAGLGAWKKGAWYSDGCECFNAPAWQYKPAKAKVAERVKQSRLVTSVRERDLKAAHQARVAEEYPDIWDGQSSAFYHPAYGTPARQFDE